MMRGTWIGLATAVVVLGALGACGKSSSDDPGVDNGAAEDQGFRTVNGFARFGSQCNFGFNGAINPEKLEAWDCPVPTSQIQLVQDLRPVILTADCKQMILTIRGDNRSMDTAWEIMPDHTFFFTVDGGKVQIKDDGSGNTNCTVPSAMDIWGKVDCPTDVANRDKVNIQFETVYWLGKNPPSPQATPSALPSILPPSPRPTDTPNPVASSSPTPHHVATFVIDRNRLRHEALPMAAMAQPIIPSASTSANGTSGQCKLPSGCYLYSSHTEKQCQ